MPLSFAIAVCVCMTTDTLSATADKTSKSYQCDQFDMIEYLRSGLGAAPLVADRRAAFAGSVILPLAGRLPWHRPSFGASL